MRNRCPPPNSEQPALTVDPHHLDFGEVWETDKFEWSFPVTNSKSEPLTISDVHGSCDCAGITAALVVVPPNSASSLRLTIDLRPKSRSSDGTATRKFSTTLSGSARFGDRSPVPVSWQLRGTVKRVFRSLSPLDFGRCSELATPMPSRVVQLDATTPLSGLTVESGTPLLQTTIRCVSAEPSRYELVVTPTSGRWTHTGTITLAPTETSGRPLPPVTIPVSAAVVPDVEAIPPSVNGGREVGSELTETISLRSLSNRPFVVERADAEGSGVTVRPGADGQVYVVKVGVMALGPSSGCVRFVVRPQGADPMELVVSVLAHGFSP